MQLYEQLKLHFTIPDAYTSWKDYRNLLTDRLIRMADEEELTIDRLKKEMTVCVSHKPTLAVLGAGRMDDLDLAAIRPYFSKITMVDQDRNAMEEALDRYGMTKDPDIVLEEASFTGIGESEYAAFCQSLETYISETDHMISVPELDMHCIALMQEILQDTMTAAWNRKTYDYIWCVGVHSQLYAMPAYIYRYMWKQLEQDNRLEPVWQHMQPEESAFMEYLREQNAARIHVLHDEILCAAKHAVVIGCEVGRCEHPYAGVIENPELPATDEQTIEGSRQCMADIDSRRLDVHNAMLCWPFYRVGNVYYDMLLREIFPG